MNRNWTLGMAVLAGVAIIWLVGAAAATAAALPGLGRLLQWWRARDWPVEWLSPGLLTLVPIFAVALLVGLFVFRLPGARALLFLCAAAPFVLYSLGMNIGMFIWAGNAVGTALLEPLPWLIATMVPAGLLVALGLSRSRGAA